MAVFFAMPGSEDLSGKLAKLVNGTFSEVEVRSFPDGETSVRVPASAARKEVFLVCRLSPPDGQFLPLIFAARAVRSRGAANVKLIAPYLPYMRQDKAFRVGDAVSAAIFADLVSREFDGLVTVDPHLHRYASLTEVYRIPTLVLSAAGLIGQWVRDHVERPVVIGPDGESERWARGVAEVAGAPWTTFLKVRESDSIVRLESPDLETWRDRQPVLVDDIVSTGATILEASRQLAEKGFPHPICAAVHGLMDDRTGKALKKSTAAFVTTDTVLNPYVRLTIAPLIAAALNPEQA